MLARITISMNATQRERETEQERQGELSHSRMEMENCYRGKRLILALPSVSPVCADSRIAFACSRGKRRSEYALLPTDAEADGGETHCERGRMDGRGCASERAMSSGQKMQLPFFE